MFVNLTPHEISVSSTVIPPSGVVARVSTTVKSVAVVEGIPLQHMLQGEVINLPPPQEGVFYITSAMVREACPFRGDVLSPGEIVRDSAGGVIGCKSFYANDVAAARAAAGPG
jgi:hypothetical protein